MAAEDVVNLTGGADLGIAGLSAAVDRLHEANARIASGGGALSIAASLGEALSWIAALDEFSAKEIGRDVYLDRRATHTEGRTVGGLIYARNAFGHQLHIAGAMKTIVHSPTMERDGDKVTLRWARLPGRDYGSRDQGTLFSIQMVWADLDELPVPRGRQYERDRWYGELVAGKPLTQPLTTGQQWFKRLHGQGEGSSD